MVGVLSEKEVQLLETLNKSLQELLTCRGEEIRNLIQVLLERPDLLVEDPKSYFSTLDVILRLAWSRRNQKRMPPSPPTTKKSRQSSRK